MQHTHPTLTFDSAIEYAEDFIQKNLLIHSAYYAVVAEQLHDAQSEQQVQSLQSIRQRTGNDYINAQTTLLKAQAEALSVRQHSFAPYSNFHVGSAIIDTTHTIWKGVNVECSSYGLTICAERSALVSMISAGHRAFTCVIVTADTPTLTPPCGACRQLLYDFSPDALVILLNTEGKRSLYSMSALLPASFHPGFLLSS
jgi:cytidine deaminase